jgi:hypothetical protein
MSAAANVPVLETKPATWWRGRRPQRGLLALVVLLGTLLRVASLDGVTRRTPDEYTYTDQANILLDMGTAAGYPDLFANFARDPVRPSPTRIGYHWLLTTTMRLTGNRTPLAGAWLACLASVLSLALLAAIGWRFLTPVAALAATLLYAVSPAELMFARRCWAESLVELLSLAALGIASAVTAGSRRRLWYPLFALAGVFALTVKELSATAFLLAAAWIVLRLVWRREGKAAACFAGTTAVAVVLALAWSAVRLGGVGQLSQLSVVGTKVAETSPYGLAYSSGPAWLLLLGLWIVSAATATLALLGIAALTASYFPRKRTAPWLPNPAILLCLTGFATIFLGLAMALPEKLNLRLVCPAFGLLALLAGVGFSALLGLIRRFLPPTEGATLSVLATAFLLLAAASDYRNFAHNFAAPDLQDLSIRMVLASDGRRLPLATADSHAPAGNAAPPLTASGWIALSAQRIEQGRNEQGIAAARQALALDPQSAVAWNNIAAANENLQRWDAAIAAAQRALQLQPDFQLAKNNLAWSLAQKAKDVGR